MRLVLRLLELQGLQTVLGQVVKAYAFGENSWATSVRYVRTECVDNETKTITFPNAFPGDLLLGFGTSTELS